MPASLPDKTWVVIADGERGVLFLQDGDGEVCLKHRQTVEPQSLNDDGPSGVRPPESSAKDTDEATFAKQLAHFVNEKAKAQEFNNLILIADPSTLGEIRPILHSEVESRLLFDMTKTLTSAPVSEIEAHVETALKDQ